MNQSVYLVPLSLLAWQMWSGDLTIIVWETDTQMNFFDLLLKEILLVKEKHNGGQRKESVVADAVEKMERLVHAIL